MKYSSAFALFVVLVFSACASAGISHVDCYNDGDGAITMNDWWNTDLTGHPSDIDIYLDEALHWAPAHAIVDITTDSELDPIARITKEVDNETTSAWSGYLINVVNAGPFSITSATEPIGWGTPTYAPNATLQLSGTYAGLYMDTVSYGVGPTGTPVGIGGTGVFKFTTSFSGSTTNTFTLEQIPVGVVPEPASLTLLVLAGMFGLVMLKRR
jgi:hypothetical protein